MSKTDECKLQEQNWEEPRLIGRLNCGCRRSDRILVQSKSSNNVSNKLSNYLLYVVPYFIVLPLRKVVNLKAVRYYSLRLALPVVPSCSQSEGRGLACSSLHLEQVKLTVSHSVYRGRLPTVRRTWDRIGDSLPTITRLQSRRLALSTYRYTNFWRRLLKTLGKGRFCEWSKV